MNSILVLFRGLKEKPSILLLGAGVFLLLEGAKMKPEQEWIAAAIVFMGIVLVSFSLTKVFEK